jgi:uncharacterized membrane protein (DUF2068 family)
VSQRSGTGVLFAIAVFKLVKAALLIALGIGALSLAHGADSLTTLRDVVRDLGLDPNRHLINQAIGKISGIDDRRLRELSVGTFVYAAVFVVEGTGLLLRKHWAEYLTSIVTASFIPFEIYEMVHKPSAVKATAVGVNVIIVVYLVRRLWGERHEKS